MTSELIRAAIGAATSNRRLVRITYHNYSRLLEPWALVLDHAGQDILIAWQVSGGSEAGAASGWQEFRITEIKGATALPETFEPDPDHKPPLFDYVGASQPG